MPTVQERVEAGIKLLNGRVPNWWEKVDVRQLQMSNCAQCVLGQLFGYFTNGVDRLKFDGSREIIDHGFDATPFSYSGTARDFDDLNDEWRRRIAELQEADKNKEEK